MDDKFYSVEQISQTLNIHPKTLRRLPANMRRNENEHGDFMASACYQDNSNAMGMTWLSQILKKQWQEHVKSYIIEMVTIYEGKECE